MDSFIHNLLFDDQSVDHNDDQSVDHPDDQLIINEQCLRSRTIKVSGEKADRRILHVGTGNK